MQYLPRIKDFSIKMSVYPWEDKSFYTNWLAQTYFYVRHTEKLLGLCIAHSNDDSELQHYKNHLKDEDGHDAILLTDLAELGESINNFEVNTVTSIFFETQYYKIQTYGPSSHLGYVILLEGLAAYFGGELFQRVDSAYSGLGANFIRLHSAEDKAHIVKAIDAANSLSNKLEIENCFAQSEFLYQHLLESCRPIRNNMQLAA